MFSRTNSVLFKAGRYERDAREDLGRVREEICGSDDPWRSLDVQRGAGGRFVLVGGSLAALRSCEEWRSGVAGFEEDVVRGWWRIRAEFELVEECGGGQRISNWARLEVIDGEDLSSAMVALLWELQWTRAIGSRGKRTSSCRRGDNIQPQRSPAPIKPPLLLQR